MTHVIKTKQGKHIVDTAIRNEIIDTLYHNLTYTYYQGTKIEILQDMKTDTGRKTIINVVGLNV